MPPGFVWIVLLGGLFVVAACWLMPREIGKEDEPVLPVNIDLPRVEDIGARVREAAWRVSRAGKRPDAIGNRREAPQAMGASQPVLTDQPAPEPYVLPANLGVDGN